MKKTKIFEPSFLVTKLDLFRLPLNNIFIDLTRLSTRRWIYVGFIREKDARSVTCERSIDKIQKKCLHSTKTREAKHLKCPNHHES